MRILLLLLALLLGGMPAFVSAQLSPGQLSNAHRNLDTPLSCAQCHVFGAGEPVFKCSECHVEIGSRVAAGRGYHGRIVDPDLEGRDCAECHREHVGRSFDLIHWPGGPERFDHSETGYPLVGAHRRQSCRTCHEAKYVDLYALRDAKVQDPARTFLGLPGDCAGCHADEHRGQLGAECESCHGFESFEDVTKFDHSRTDFELTGRHRNVECVECHPRESGYARYAGLAASACKTCHADTHDGAFRQGCESCHTAAGWKAVRLSRSFDHSATEFALAGKHAEVACGECHAEARFGDPVAHARCLDCHQDPHGAQFEKRSDAGDCGACHDETGFKPTHVHERRSPTERLSPGRQAPQCGVFGLP